MAMSPRTVFVLHLHQRNTIPPLLNFGHYKDVDEEEKDFDADDDEENDDWF